MITIKSIDGKFRLMDDLDEIAVNLKTGKPLDGGGHYDESKANRQASYINMAFEKNRKTKNATRQ